MGLVIADYFFVTDLRGTLEILMLLLV